MEDPDSRKRLLQDPGVRPFVARALKDGTIQLKEEHTVKRLRALLRDLDYLVDLILSTCRTREYKAQGTNVHVTR